MTTQRCAGKPYSLPSKSPNAKKTKRHGGKKTGLQVWPAGRWLVFALAGALAVLAAMALANALLPMPTLIGANRSLAGTLGLMACGSLGALLFAVLARRSPPAQA